MDPHTRRQSETLSSMSLTHHELGADYVRIPNEVFLWLFRTADSEAVAVAALL